MAKLLKTNSDDDKVEFEKPSSAQIVASIEDLSIDIIKRLPLKKIVQFKLVSKYWNSLISDPKLRLLRNQLSAVGLIFEGITIDHPYTDPTTNHPYSYIISLDKSISPPFRKITPTKDSWFRPCKILNSCNGLLLCIDKQKHYYVCNPTTMKYILLPKVLDHSAVSIRGMSLAYDPSKSPHYKVVCVVRCSSWEHVFAVYCSETGSWRECGEIFRGYDEFNCENGVYWNGAIHWYPRCVYLNLDCDETETKRFRRPPLQRTWYNDYDYHFGESCGHLHFVDAKSVLAEFIVYEMKRDYSEWFVKYKVIIPEISRDYSEWFGEFRKGIIPNIGCMPRLYTVVRGMNDEDSFLVIAIRKRVVRYNFENKTCEILCDFESTVGDRPAYWGAIRPSQYIESFCSV